MVSDWIVVDFDGSCVTRSSIGLASGLDYSGFSCDTVNFFLCFDFSKTFVTISHDILIDKLIKYRLEKRTVRCTENWLSCQAETVKFSWRPVISGLS